MMSLIVPLIPLASKPRPACLAATAAAHKLPDGRRAQTAHFQLSYYECKVPTNVTDVCPISNSPTTSATKLRMCVGSGGLSVPRVWAEAAAAAVAVGGGRRAGMPAAPPNGGGRSTAAAGCGNRCYGGGSKQRCAIGVRAAGVCGPPLLFAPGGVAGGRRPLAAVRAAGVEPAALGRPARRFRPVRRRPRRFRPR